MAYSALNCVSKNLAISQDEFNLISRLVSHHLGIKLNESKLPLVTGRLSKLVVDGGFQSFNDYYHHVVNDKSGKALSILADNITTNHTYFCREYSHFDFLRTVVLPETEARLRRRNCYDIRIWCAASSTGEGS